jgi:hypothetical protein
MSFGLLGSLGLNGETGNGAGMQPALFLLAAAPAAGAGVFTGGHRTRARVATAKVDRADDAYFRTQIEPLLDGPGVEFIGEINEHQKTQFLGEAQALLFPVDWPEPFGLSMIEAMACGTPVLAFRCGSVPAIVEDGITGAIVDTIEEAIVALPKVIALDRKKVRQRFEQRFSATRMAIDYVGVYRSLLKSSKSLDSEVPISQDRLRNGKDAIILRSHIA